MDGHEAKPLFFALMVGNFGVQQCTGCTHAEQLVETLGQELHGDWES